MGWKGKTGGIIVILAGVLQAFQAGLPQMDVTPPGAIQTAIGVLFSIGTGLGIVGIRAKQERDRPGT